MFVTNTNTYYITSIESLNLKNLSEVAVEIMETAEKNSTVSGVLRDIIVETTQVKTPEDEHAKLAFAEVAGGRRNPGHDNIIKSFLEALS